MVIREWIPAFAGMSSREDVYPRRHCERCQAISEWGLAGGWMPAFAGMEIKRGGLRPPRDADY